MPFYVVARTSSGVCTTQYESYDYAVQCAKKNETARIYQSDGERATLVWVGGKALTTVKDRDGWTAKSSKAQQVLF